MKDGQYRVNNDLEDKETKLQQDLNIQRSSLVIKQRMEMMNKRDGLMKQLVLDALDKLQNEISLPDNEKYQEVIKNLILQGCIKLLEPIIVLRIRECDKTFIEGALNEVKERFQSHMMEETGREYTVEF